MERNIAAHLLLFYKTVLQWQEEYGTHAQSSGAAAYSEMLRGGFSECVTVYTHFTADT